MIRVRDLSNPAVALEWHEAVAVVSALTDTLWNARAAQAPTLEAAALTPEGDVEIVGEGRLAGAVTSGLALALGALLEATPCPAELRQIVTANVGPGPEIDTVDGFARALMFFERPGRPHVLSDLASRAAEALERARAAEELERLTERARHRAQVTTPPPPQTSTSPTESPRRLVAPAAVGLTVFIAVALAAATLFTTAPPRALEPAVRTGPVDDDEAPASGDVAVEAVRPKPGAGAPSGHAGPGAGSRDSSIEAKRDGRTVSTAGASTSHASSSPSVAATPPAGVKKAAPATRGSDIEVRVTELGGAPLPSSPNGNGAAGRGASRVYTASDSGVSPAILVKPHLPAEPPSDVPPWEVGTLELTVGTSGTVEQVHLISPYNRYQERMLVAAAKAWLFQPATKDGRPVRFRTRIRVTL